ncbi:MAG: hypothetical protein HY904_05815 [Deltaproteobacteria bacterium]|nr:hypothetical protein [Deltaproteobacteria bacterium]
MKRLSEQWHASQEAIRDALLRRDLDEVERLIGEALSTCRGTQRAILQTQRADLARERGDFHGAARAQLEAARTVRWHPYWTVRAARAMLDDGEDRAQALVLLKRAEPRVRAHDMAWHCYHEMLARLALDDGHHKVAAVHLLVSLDIREWGWITLAHGCLIERIIEHGGASAQCRQYLEKAAALLAHPPRTRDPVKADAYRAAAQRVATSIARLVLKLDAR